MRDAGMVVEVCCRLGADFFLALMARQGCWLRLLMGYGILCRAQMGAECLHMNRLSDDLSRAIEHLYIVGRTLTSPAVVMCVSVRFWIHCTIAG